MRSRYLNITGLIALLFATAATANPEALSRVEDAVEVLKLSSKVPEQRIPNWLLRDAQAIAVVPDVVKAGLVLGGRRGRGLVSVRDNNGAWSTPSFITLTGGSIGFQAGVQKTDVILVFKTRRSIETIVNGTFTLGGDAAVAAGPIGREARAATDAGLQAEIYAYSRSRGLFAGVSLDGSALKIDHDNNASVYGSDATPRKIFAGQLNYAAGQAPEQIVDFRDMLEEVTNL